MKKILLVLMTCLIVLSMIAGCASQAEPVVVETPDQSSSSPVVEEQVEDVEEATEAPDVEEVTGKEDVLVVAQQADAYSMDPTQHTQKPTASILFHIYDPLVIRGADGKIGPGLAESWEQLEPTRWRFYLRQGVNFTNGEPMDADAVVYSIMRAIDPATESPYLSRVNAIEKAEKVDSYTVDITTKSPDPVLLLRLEQLSFPMLIVPPKHVQANGDRVPEDNPIGTGPYKFVEWVKDDHITLVANEDYWGGKPEVETVVFRPIPETSARVSALKNNEVNLIVNVSPELGPSIDSDPNTKLLPVASDNLYFIVFNTETVEAFQNKLVRQALNYAVDVDTILETIMLGYGERIAVTMTKNGFGYPKNVEPYSYDPQKAKDLLAEAGYPDGFGPIVFMSRNGRYLKDAEIVQAVAQYLDEVGVKTEVQFVEGGVWGDLGNQHARGDINFPGWSGLDPEVVWYPILHCGEFQSYYCNPVLDVILESARTTIDQVERESLYQEAGEIIFDEAPHIPLFQPYLIFAASDNLMWTAPLDDIINLRGVFFED